MRIVLTGGGTGGHISGRWHMKQQHPDTQLLYIGTSRGLESRIVPEQGIPFEAARNNRLPAEAVF